MNVVVIGRFPPPIDGQTMATQRLVELLAPKHSVVTVNMEPPSRGYVAAEVRFRPDRVFHFLKMRRPVRHTLQQHPHAPVLWTSISPVPLGHWRDLVTVMPALQPGQRIYAIAHRAIFDELFTSSLTAVTAQRMTDRMAGFVFLNQALSDRCARWIPPDKRFVIPNTIDQAVFCNDATIHQRQQRSPGRPLQLLFLSNMMPEKGYLDILEALPILRQRGVAFEAHFAGNWVQEADRVQFEQVVQHHALHDVVIHHGGLTNREIIRQHYLEADVFLLPSYHPTEAQPIALIEAMNAATPIVATHHASLPEMLGEGRDALLVPPQQPEAIAQAIERLTDPETWQTYSHRARQRFLTVFSPQAVQAHWESLLSEQWTMDNGQWTMDNGFRIACRSHPGHEDPKDTR